MTKKTKKQKKFATELDDQVAEVKATEKDSCYYWDGDTLVLNIIGTPSAKRNAIGGVRGHELKVSVRETPEGGKATDYMVRFLAKELDVLVKDIQVVYGQFSVHKQLRIKNPKILPKEIEPK